MEDRMSFGARVRKLRVEAGMSRKVLGDHIHYSKAQISRVEQGLSAPSTTFAAACDRVFSTGDELARVAAMLAVANRRVESEPRFDMPAGPRKLIGREREVEELERYLRTTDERWALRVCVLHGLPGVGKTAIALRVAESLREDYPDGRLYLDMQGYNLDNRPVGEEEALDRILRRLGVAGEMVPRTVEEKGALLRHKLANRRVLLILDSVGSAHQVANLMPPNGLSAVILTSRRSLTALDAAFHRQVDALDPMDATELFLWVAQLTPESDIRGDPAAVAEITRLCYELPLAVCIVASRFRDNPVRRLEDVAARLADQAVRLRELDDGVRSVSAVFAASCATLSDAQRTMLALIALHPGPKVDAHAAAALAGLAPATAEELLDELIRSGMLEWHSHNAYRLHDLLRDHLRRPEAGTLSESEAAAAQRRLFDYYLHTAAMADSLIDNHRYHVPIGLPSPTLVIPELTDVKSAKEWMNREADNFVTIVSEMGDRGEDTTSWQYAYYLRGYFYATKQWELMTSCYEVALESATRSGDHQAQAIVLNNLGLANTQLGRTDEAMRHFSRARVEFATANDPYGEMNVVANHSWLAYDIGDYELALDLAKASREFYSVREQHSNAAIALDCIARCELRLGLLAEAEKHFLQALSDFADLRFRDGDTAQLLSYLGETELRLERPEQAAEHYHQAILRARSGEAPREEAVAFEGLSRAAAAKGQVVDADAHRAAAIALYDEVGATERAERLRTERTAQSTEERREFGRESEPRPQAKVTSRQPLCVLAINTEWSSKYGGLSTLNRELCKALAAQGADVFCSTPHASEEERRDAQAAGVRLVHPPASLELPEAALSRPPTLPSGVVPDIVIGHGRKTGEAAMWLVEDHFRDAKLIYFFHVISDRVEFEKDHGPNGDPMTAAEQRIQNELVIARRAHLTIGIGPVLHHYLRDRLRGSGCPEPLRLDPGFDVIGPAAEPPPLSDTARVLLVGRLSLREARVKGVDIAARALGHALRQRGRNEPEVELVLRGVEAGQGKAVADAVRDWAGVPALRVIPRPYASDTATLSQDLHQANLVVMPSRTEGFGLVGLEAITTGVPALISKQSGLGALLDEERSGLSVELRVIPITDDDQTDQLRWGDAMASVLHNPRLAFMAASTLREEMAARRTWGMAATTLSSSMKALLGQAGFA